MLTSAEKEKLREKQYSLIVNSEPGWDQIKQEINKVKALIWLGMNEVQPEEYSREKTFTEFDRRVYCVMWPTDGPYEIALKMRHLWPSYLGFTKNRTLSEHAERVRRSLAKRENYMILYSNGCEKCKHLGRLLKENGIEFEPVNPNSPDRWRETKKADAMAFIILHGYDIPVLYDGKTFLTYEQCLDKYKPLEKAVQCKEGACSLVA